MEYDILNVRVEEFSKACHRFALVFLATELGASLAVYLLFTVRLHVMQRTVLLSEFCPSVCLSVCPSVCLSVCPSVRCVYCNKTKQRTANILIHTKR